MRREKTPVPGTTNGTNHHHHHIFFAVSIYAQHLCRRRRRVQITNQTH